MTKVVILSNFINHHIRPFCDELNNICDSFYFVSRKKIAPKRIPLGWKDISDECNYVIKTYESNEEISRAFKETLEADYVITGDADDKYIIKRLKSKKITFKDSEHIFRSQHKKFSWLRKFRRVYINHGKFMKYPLFLLCSSAYAASDFNKYNAYIGRTYKWGYFPETKEYNVDSLFSAKRSTTISILWAGRFLKLKHPEYAVFLAIKLKEMNIKFHINMIGNGTEYDVIKNMIKANYLDDYITLLGSMNPDEVRNNMEKSQIFLFTSNHDEGWGVVLNEAMNSGCACIASSGPGSTGFLIKHKKNGLIFKDEDFNDLLNNFLYLIKDANRIESFGKKAYQTIIEDFNAKVAAERFLILSKNLSEGKETPFTEGLCSKAYPISECEMFDYLVK